MLADWRPPSRPNSAISTLVAEVREAVVLADTGMAASTTCEARSTADRRGCWHYAFDRLTEGGLRGPLLIVRKVRAAEAGLATAIVWIKTKCERGDAFVVVGFDVEKAGRVHSLHLAWRKGATLVYAGSVEIGIDDATARKLHERLAPLRQLRSPLPAAVKGVCFLGSDCR